MNQRQLHYLQAMGVEVWLPRGAPAGTGPAASPDGQAALHAVPASAARLRLGPGNGSCLLVCAEPGQTATLLASDLARVLGGAPVWAWPSDEAQSTDLAAAVDERLFTSVVIFGADLAREVCGGQPPAGCGGAQLLVAPGLDQMTAQADARRRCWAVLRSGGLQLGK